MKTTPLLVDHILESIIIILAYMVTFRIEAVSTLTIRFVHSIFMVDFVCYSSFPFSMALSIISLFKHLAMKLWRVAFLFRILYTIFLWVEFLMSAWGFKGFYILIIMGFFYALLLFSGVFRLIFCVSFVFPMVFVFWLNGGCVFVVVVTISELGFGFVLYSSLVLHILTLPLMRFHNTISVSDNLSSKFEFQSECFCCYCCIGFLVLAIFLHRSIVESWNWFSLLFLIFWNAFVNIY